MNSFLIAKKINYPVCFFFIGFILILIIPIFPIQPGIELFDHNWRPELMTAIILLGSLIYLNFISRQSISLKSFSIVEFRYLILPATAFIVWSGFSLFWADSWKSALHHTLVWFCYLTFYITTRFTLRQKNAYITSLVILSVFIWVISFSPTLQYFSLSLFGNPTTPGLSYSMYAELVNCLVPLLIFFVLSLKDKWFYFGVLTILFAYTLIISSVSRSALILLILSSVLISVTVFFVKHFHQYRKRLSVIFGSIFAVVLILHSIPAIINSFSTDSDSATVIPMAERITPNYSTNYSNNIRPFLAQISFEMWKTAPIFGVGANNFGQEFGKYRENYAISQPDDKNLYLTETEYAARTHNEFLQIFAELGIIGGLIFLFFLYGILRLHIKIFRHNQKLSLNFVGSAIGIMLFLISSLVTSYSFRLTQNGLVFFFLLAVLVNELRKQKLPTVKINYDMQFKFFRPLSMACCVILMIFVSFLSVRVAGKYYSLQAIKSSTLEEAVPLHEWAIYLDNENADSHYFYAMHLFINKKYAEAVPLIQDSIRLGRTTSPTFSYLSTAQMLSGDFQAAEETMKRTVTFYPYSVFARTRYSMILNKNSKSQLAEKEFQTAVALDSKQAETWRSFLNDGARKTTLKAHSSEDMVKIMDLKPSQAIYAVLDEREILYPEEKMKRANY